MLNKLRIYKYIQATMPTAKDYKDFIKANRPNGCRPYSKLKKNELMILARELGFGTEQPPPLPTTTPKPAMPKNPPPKTSPFETKEREIKEQPPKIPARPKKGQQVDLLKSTISKKAEVKLEPSDIELLKAEIKKTDDKIKEQMGDLSEDEFIRQIEARKAARNKQPETKQPEIKQPEKSDTSEIETRDFVKWEDILKIDDKKMDEYSKQFYYLYTEIPPRWWEYNNMFVDMYDDELINEDKLNKWDINKYIEMYKKKPNNYLVMYNNTPQFIVLNNYRTVKTYKSYVIDLNKHKKLQKNLMPGNAYAAANSDFNDPNAGRNTMYDKKKYTPTQTELLDYETFIRGIFKVKNKQPNISLIRIAYILWTRKQKYSNEKLKEIAEQMGHSLRQANTIYKKYSKLVKF